ncbi:hypothetical protein, partial [Acetobacter oeni]|uniref:hypothetical protein n=1 Tax=Acetobacter oeni TaxID=304077 RepID=UPI0011BED75D
MPPDVVQGEVQKIFYEQWDSQIPRWGSKFCPVVLGLSDPFGGMVLEALNQTARSLIPDIPPQCNDKNVFLLFSDDGTALFNMVYNRIPTLGNGYDSSGISPSDLDLPDKQLVKELRQNRPVRWYRSISTDHEAGTLLGSRAQSALVGAKGTQARTTSTIVIVDQNLASGATWQQLIDYLTVVVLAAPKLGGTFNENSIMSLFNDNHFQTKAPPRLTSFDTELLHALYEADPAQDAHSEQMDIARTVSKNVTSTIQNSTP